jgi:hypothetical protein
LKANTDGVALTTNVDLISDHKFTMLISEFTARL